MYHCKTKFHLTGNERYFPVIKNIPPLEHFTHEFVENAGAADVIIADIGGISDGGALLKTLVDAKKAGAELIVLADSFEALGVPLGELTDVWITPMSEDAFLFRFEKWQERFKNDKDRWQSEQYLDALIDNIPSMVWFKSRDGRHEKVNADFCRTVGKTREDVTGKSHAYIWDVPSDDPACVESDNRAMYTETTVVSEEHVATKNGERELTSYKSPLYDLDGSVMGTVGFAIDITKERAFENEVMTKNKTLEHMFASIDCGMMWHSYDGKDVYYINRTALDILGYKSVEELMEDGFDYIARSVIEEDRAMLSEQIKLLKKTGDSVNVEYRVRHKDGKALHIMGNVKLMEEDGRPYYQRYLLDVTEQKKETSEKEHRRDELVQVLAANYSVVCYFDLTTGFGSVHHINDSENDSLREIFKGRLELESTIARYCDSFVNVEDRVLVKVNCDRAFLKRTLMKKESHLINFRVTQNGKESYYRIKAVKVGSDFGVVLGIRNVDEEIRREMEDKTLLENALRQANRANKAKSVFLSNMSHDIRTPMNAIVGFTTLALSHIDSKEQVEGYLRKIMTSGEHLLNLINDVLDMSRIESGKMQIEENPCSLPDILHGLRNMIRPDVLKKQMELQTDMTDIRHEDIVCDKLRLNQVLLNLLSNSVKYTPEGGRITFKATESPSPNEGFAFYDFVVSDNGMGMSEDFVRHIFEPFERERNTTLSGIQGTGLGMAITKNIVDMMNGTINVKSRPGEGTEVTVRLELRLAEHVGAVKKDTSRNTEKPPRKSRILLVEDNDLNQEIAATLLTEAGFEVEVAENGQIALDMLTVSEPNYYGVILMDIQMPVMNGYEATKRIRALDNEAHRGIPILAMTANAFEEDKKAALQSGMNGHLAKPIDIDKLLETLEELLEVSD